MRYFTRDLVDALQDAGKVELESAEIMRSADAAWEQAQDQYWEYIEEVRHLLPPSLRALVDTTFHDSVIERVDQSEAGIELVLDTRRCPAGSYGHARLRFVGVRSASRFQRQVGRTILYEEFYIDPSSGRYEYHILLDQGEIDLQFSELSFETT